MRGRLSHAGLVLVLAWAVRLAHLAAVAPTPFFDLHRSFAESDMHMFDEWSAQIARGDWLGRDIPHPLYRWQTDLASERDWRSWYGNPRTFYKAPLYAYLLAALRAAFGDPMLPLALLQCLVSALAAALMVGLGDRLFGAPAGLAAGLLFAVYGPAIHFDVVMLRGPFIAASALAATAGLLRLAEAPSPRSAFASGLWLSLALLANEGFAPVPLLVLACLPFWMRGATALLRGCVALLCGLALGCLPLVVRNLMVGAPPLGLAVTGSIVYAVFNAHGASPWAFEIHPQQLAPLMAEAGAGLPRMALACLRTFPDAASLASFYGERVLGLLAPFENPDNANFYYAALVSPLLRFLPGYGSLLPLAALGAGLAIPRRARLLPLLPFALALLASIMMTTTLSRYRVVFAVFLMPFAGLALATAGTALMARDWRRVAGMGAAAVAAAVLAQGAETHLGVGGGIARLRYRPAEFYLASQGWERRGNLARAGAEMLSLVRNNRDPEVQAWALVRAGSLAALQDQGDRARELLDLAAVAGARNPGLLLAVGDARRDRLLDRAGAADAYRAALALPLPPALGPLIEERLRSVAAAPAVQ